MRGSAILRQSLCGILLVTMATLLPASARGDAAADRQTLKDKLRIYYIDQPNAVPFRAALLDNDAIANGTRTGLPFSNAAVPRFHQLVTALIAPPNGGGDEELQQAAAGIIRILDKPVAVRLVNDTAGGLTAAAISQWDVCPSLVAVNDNRAWPCAINQSLADDYMIECARRRGVAAPARKDGQWAGYMSLGAQLLQNGHFAGDPGRRRAFAVFLHELVHTQDRSDSRAHMFWVNGRTYRYGDDDVHYTTEAVPNRAMTHTEGIANVFSMLYDTEEWNRYFQWFANNGVMLVEQQISPPVPGAPQDPCHAVTAPSPDVWLFNQLVAAGVTPLPQSTPLRPAGYAGFRIRSLPPRFVMHNEMILALVFAEYVRHISLDNYVIALKNSNDRLFRVSASGTAMLFEALCHAGLPEGETLQSVSGANRTGRKTYLLPLAYADYFTGYRANTKAEYKQIFEGLLPDGWIDLYWDGYRQVVRAAVPITPTTKLEMGQLTDIAIALGINRSQPGPGN